MLVSRKRKNFLQNFSKSNRDFRNFSKSDRDKFSKSNRDFRNYSKSDRDKIPKSNRDFGNFSKSNRDKKKKNYQVHSYKKKSLLYDHIITVKNGFIDHIKYTVYCQNFVFCTVESGHIPTVKNEKLYGGIWEEK